MSYIRSRQNAVGQHVAASELLPSAPGLFSVSNMEMTQAIRVEDIEEINEIVGVIKPVLAGRQAPITSAVLAELLSMWLAGHFVAGEREETERLRETLLKAHCELVRDLTELNAEVMGTNQ